MRPLTFASITACNFARTVPTTSSLEGRALLSATIVRTATEGSDSGPAASFFA